MTLMLILLMLHGIVTLQALLQAIRRPFITTSHSKHLRILLRILKVIKGSGQGISRLVPMALKVIKGSGRRALKVVGNNSSSSKHKIPMFLSQDLIQDMEDMEDLSQDLEDLSQDLSQEMEDLSQGMEDLTQGLEDLSHQQVMQDLMETMQVPRDGAHHLRLMVLMLLLGTRQWASIASSTSSRSLLVRLKDIKNLAATWMALG